LIFRRVDEPRHGWKEAENTACLVMTQVDLHCHPVPATAIAGILDGSPASVTMCVTRRLRANLIPTL
jgi:hypothetical protein